MKMDKTQMKVGGQYKWKFLRDKLIYLGKQGLWHQFKKIGDPRDVGGSKRRDCAPSLCAQSS